MDTVKKYPSGHKKVLILYAPFGSGHAMAAKAIAEAFVVKYPNVEVKEADVASFFYKILSKTLVKSYDYVTVNVPFVYKWIYDFNNNRLRHKLLSNTSSIVSNKSNFVKFIQEYNPDFIISTNPLPMQLVSKTKEKGIIDILSANVCTDFGFHSLWYNKDVNYYFVANNEVEKALCQAGADSESIQITGIPVSSKIKKTVDREAIIKSLGFNQSGPILLVVGGRIDYKKLLKIINGLLHNNNSLQIIIVSGRDDVLFEKLKKSGLDKNPSLKIFGFVDNLDEYMSISDLILTKAGGLTMAECIVRELPMVISDIIPGQEEDNLKYAVSKGFAIEEKNAGKLVRIVTDLFDNPEKLSAMKKACDRLSKPDAAEKIADFIFSKI